MYPSNGLNKFPFQHLPASWFIRRREHLETYYDDLSGLKGRIARFASHRNVAAVLSAADAMNQLNLQIQAMEENIESKLLELSEYYDFHNRGDLQRIRELSITIATELETIAGKISWGSSADLHISQVSRNLHLLLRLLQDTLNWLEQGID